MNERRLARLAQQIKQRLAVILQRELADPKLGLVTITRIELDTEFTHCKAYWSVIAPTGEEARARRDSSEALARARGFCQREMGRVLHTRSIPQLQFYFDEGISRSIEMNKLLKELNPKGPDDHADGTDPAADAPLGGDPDGTPKKGPSQPAPAPPPPDSDDESNPWL
ncbi:MAG: 30S ribosome-binding factor RbfA [Planctomycetota bacterium]